jgi:lipopolysaccharide/colanic/teichoic acid biosynthesis glycosyltransferase
MLAVAALVRWHLGSPVLFRQPRAGKNGRSFTLYKFRTMRDAKDQQERPLPDDQRLTIFGHWLRSLSLDELPQLWNILRGDMSVVGPRPLLVRYLNRYSPEQARRHEVRPGITGWAQVNGRNALSWEQKFELDVWYVDHCSFPLDLRILLRTIGSVLTRRGISANDHVSMTEFMGSHDENAVDEARQNI